ncbi:YhbY family RNA-binding protein [Opitutus sp. GAS368]|jgi:RNA-binding protein|uniref:YhbY family RNA-binding protein n=1 Tax=Opitutus sp. GAS368 TaxID=1882749 RepID=UPI00087A862C|nr:YhbY family RNA-binding protein [Opitutus sp. GAS368]SDS07603.1 RNA-binding protein [Opitutus sp. GAS368]
MNELPLLTGAQKTQLRGLGQQLSDSLRIGRQGPTPALFTELNRQLDTRELVKVRFEVADRDERALLCEKMAADTPCLCVGSVGRTALFWRPGPEGSKLLPA